MAELEVLAVGPQALVEDLGRPGVAHLGVPASGAADRASLAQGNRLLGNPAGAAGIEVLLGGFACRVDSPVLLALTGAPVAATLDDEPAPFGTPFAVRRGQRLALSTPEHEMRTYLCVRGGLGGTRHFGSVAADPTSGLGTPPLAPGDRLPIGTASDEPTAGLAVAGVDTAGAPIEVRATWGPRQDRLTGRAARQLAEGVWTVSPQLDRVGIRLEGATLSLRSDEQLSSEGVVRGAVQVPPSGAPVIFLADHPTTGGYPVVAVVADRDTDRLAQLRPGDRLRLRLRPVSWTTD
ncbi:biotin-dependent carboxyltransferase family protein [Allobranchiibius sp. GilTou73]|uniref:5-oxoprolinase subunit C family protein n=1 Tax=Allobranchiibius sp. GilTou73 TaxID=2904523 RepID=UPI001F481A62|nr:biotin-dependent carboxyltransferase family protein [Allobranchiibius sp. GilTou73]UIJ36181.1 biotin-dependent carboxyltransferase family protein [Allobranchiibius sp. GilTou73]